MVGSDREKRELGEAAVAGPMRHRAEFYLTGLRDTLARLSRGPSFASGICPAWPAGLAGLDMESKQRVSSQDSGRAGVVVVGKGGAQQLQA
ncbi:hypothetical protein ACRE_082180 [Hapsidospora chrysogenum ATCC 11550]|uniref:Uncharacterized protein n=1 Tax=Hapsidospora chrysogenum (strain ATCC 11550 / CBS 779.69 / DSM 880 / IAM 14645 / JCM 23072 / IMI 49137) TaxID=857340 RepID=A0A086SVE0_HAPC1|nr:hypothetical protein ACRE_082180 [Hapsidospora chrysogenum ATCC 11550]